MTGLFPITSAAVGCCFLPKLGTPSQQHNSQAWFQGSLSHTLRSQCYLLLMWESGALGFWSLTLLSSLCPWSLCSFLVVHWTSFCSHSGLCQPPKQCTYHATCLPPPLKRWTGNPSSSGSWLKASTGNPPVCSISHCYSFALDVLYCPLTWQHTCHSPALSVHTSTG